MEHVIGIMYILFLLYLLILMIVGLVTNHNFHKRNNIPNPPKKRKAVGIVHGRRLYRDAD